MEISDVVGQSKVRWHVVSLFKLRKELCCAVFTVNGTIKDMQGQLSIKGGQLTGAMLASNPLMLPDGVKPADFFEKKGAGKQQPPRIGAVSAVILPDDGSVGPALTAIRAVFNIFGDEYKTVDLNALQAERQKAAADAAAAIKARADMLDARKAKKTAGRRK